MKNYQQLKTEALESFSQHGKVGQKIVIERGQCKIKECNCYTLTPLSNAAFEMKYLAKQLRQRLNLGFKP